MKTKVKALQDVSVMLNNTGSIGRILRCPADGFRFRLGTVMCNGFGCVLILMFSISVATKVFPLNGKSNAFTCTCQLVYSALSSDFVSRKNKALPAIVFSYLSRLNISQQYARAVKRANGILSCIRIPANAGQFSLLQVVWSRKGLQRSSYGSSWSQPRRPIQLLFSQVYDENSTYVSRPGTYRPYSEEVKNLKVFCATWFSLSGLKHLLYNVVYS